MREQLDLFSHVAAVYAEAAGTLRNASLYQAVAERIGMSEEHLNARIPVGASAAQHSPITRKIRWVQQTLKQLRVIERVEGDRGVWKLTERAGKDLDRAAAGVKLVAFHTELGMAIWSRHQNVFPTLDEYLGAYRPESGARRERGAQHQQRYFRG
jgi:hypothetical protein